MTVNQIQQFLNSKVPSCDTMGTQTSEYGGGTRLQWAEAHGYSAPFTCLKDFSENGRSSAQIIYDTAQQFSINPQVLLVLLQKEQALVTDTWPISIQYRSATGYGCPDSAACDSQYYGLTNQITWSARMFRAILNNSSTWYTPKTLGNNSIQWNPSTSCGSSIVNIENRSTQALYNYTPYQPNQAALNAGYGNGDSCSSYGNRNFYLYFSDWFGGTRQSAIVRTATSPTFYLLTDGKRYAISSGDILYAYGLQGLSVTVVSDNYLNSVTDGGVLSTLFTIQGDPTTYLADGGKRYGIPSGTYCTNWGLQCGNTSIQKSIGLEIFNSMPDGGVLKPIMQFSGSYYLMVNGQAEQFTSQQAMTEHSYSTTDAITIQNWTNAIRQAGVLLPENNSFVKFGSGNGIYIYSGNKFYSIPDMNTYLAWSYGKTVFTDNTSAYNITPPTTTDSLNLLYSSSGSYYALNQTQSYKLTGATPATGTALNLDVNTSLKPLVASRPTIIIDNSKAIAPPGGTIYSVQDTTLRPIVDMQDLRLQYADSNIVTVPISTLKAYTTSKSSVSPGRIIKASGSQAIYVVGSDNNLWIFDNTKELAQILNWSSGTVVNANLAGIDFTSIKQFADVIKIGSNFYIAPMDGSLRSLPVGLIADESQVTPLSGTLANKQVASASSLGFIKFENGTIFQVNSTELNPISSMQTFNSLGGTPSNTTELPMKSLNIFKIGNTR
jgi:hypothetical protein